MLYLLAFTLFCAVTLLHILVSVSILACCPDQINLDLRAFTVLKNSRHRGNYIMKNIMPWENVHLILFPRSSKQRTPIMY